MYLDSWLFKLVLSPSDTIDLPLKYVHVAQCSTYYMYMYLYNAHVHVHVYASKIVYISPSVHVHV